MKVDNLERACTMVWEAHTFSSNMHHTCEPAGCERADDEQPRLARSPSDRLPRAEVEVRFPTSNVIDQIC